MRKSYLGNSDECVLTLTKEEYDVFLVGLSGICKNTFANHMKTMGIEKDPEELFKVAKTMFKKVCAPLIFD